MFLMKCPKFTWSICHHFFSFVFCRPSNGNQLRIEVFHCLLFRLHNISTIKKKKKKPTVSCGFSISVNTARASGTTWDLLCRNQMTLSRETSHTKNREWKRTMRKLATHNRCKNHSKLTTVQEDWNWNCLSVSTEKSQWNPERARESGLEFEG